MLRSASPSAGITPAGEALWIQLGTASSLEEVDELVQLAGIGADARQRVADRQALVATDFMQQVGLPATEAPAVILSSSPVLLAATHRLALDGELAPSTHLARR